MLDAGHIAVSSNFVPEGGLELIHTKQTQHDTDDDYARLKSMMYDRFHVELKDTQVRTSPTIPRNFAVHHSSADLHTSQLLLGKSFDQCASALHKHEGREDVHLLERISMQFDVMNCIVDNAPNLTRFKVEGDLPELKVNFSDRKYKIVMSMIEVAIPKFDNQEEYPEVDHPKHFSADPKKRLSTSGERSSYHNRPSFGISPSFRTNRHDTHHRTNIDLDKHMDASAEGADVYLEEDVFFEAPDLSQAEKVGYSNKICPPLAISLHSPIFLSTDREFQTNKL